MLKNRVFYVLLLITAVMIYIFTNTYYTLTLMLLCILLPAISLVLMIISGKEMDISVDVPGTASKQDAVLTYSFTNKVKLPVARVTMHIRLENQMTGTQSSRRIAATVDGRKTVSAALALKDACVGTVMVTSEKIRIYDAFGIFAFKRSDLPEKAMIIYPDMREVAVHTEKPVESSGDGSRYSPDRPGFDVSEIFALREYVPGDEIRKIHWKLSSKIDRTMVRDFSLPLNYNVFLLLELVRGSEKLVDAQVETYLALSYALLENGINHNMGWYDAGSSAFYVRELDDFEDMEMATAQLLTSYASPEAGNALDYYSASGYSGRQNILLYVVTEPDLDKIAELEVSQRMQTIFIYENEAAAQAAREYIDVMAVSVEDAVRGIPEIIV